jgi:hypothetical protein
MASKQCAGVLLRPHGSFVDFEIESKAQAADKKQHAPYYTLHQTRDSAMGRLASGASWTLLL